MRFRGNDARRVFSLSQARIFGFTDYPGHYYASEGVVDTGILTESDVRTNEES